MTVPEKFGSLKHLVQVQAPKTKLSCAVPDALYKATALEELRLEDNALTDTLLPRMGDLKQLRDLRLGENDFFGSLPSFHSKYVPFRSKKYRRVCCFSSDTFFLHRALLEFIP
jgi:hypothetical protein